MINIATITARNLESAARVLRRYFIGSNILPTDSDGRTEFDDDGLTASFTLGSDSYRWLTAHALTLAVGSVTLNLDGLQGGSTTAELEKQTAYAFSFGKNQAELSIDDWPDDSAQGIAFFDGLADTPPASITLEASASYLTIGMGAGDAGHLAYMNALPVNRKFSIAHISGLAEGDNFDWDMQTGSGWRFAFVLPLWGSE